jgi:hypothetical protein
VTVRSDWRRAVPAVAVMAVGVAIAAVDSRPGFDATGITAVSLFLAAAVVAALDGRRPWLWALAVGAWVPLVEIPASGSFASLAALLFAGAGAAAGHLAARGLNSR